MEEKMFLARGTFRCVSRNLKFISDEHYDQSRDGDKATDEDILEELRYLLLYEHLTVPISRRGYSRRGQSLEYGSSEL